MTISAQHLHTYGHCLIHLEKKHEPINLMSLFSYFFNCYKLFKWGQCASVHVSLSSFCLEKQTKPLFKVHLLVLRVFHIWWNAIPYAMHITCIQYTQPSNNSLLSYYYWYFISIYLFYKYKDASFHMRGMDFGLFRRFVAGLIFNHSM